MGWSDISTTYGKRATAWKTTSNMTCIHLNRVGIIGGSITYLCSRQDDLLWKYRISNQAELLFGRKGFEFGQCPLYFRQHPDRCPAKR
jgi:hypothetical protein